MWYVSSSGEKEFTGGKDAWQLAALAAKECVNYSDDDEDEQIADEPISCYNCRYRRWTMYTFVCRK